MDSKHNEYGELVRKRKKCFICQGLTNPSSVGGGIFDSNHIGPWSRWQGNLNANVMIVGQDWGPVNALAKANGFEPSGFKTNENLVKILASIGISIERPMQKETVCEVFMINVILCLKEGDSQASISKDFAYNCCVRFLDPLIKLIAPIAVISLGQIAYESIAYVFDLRRGHFSNAVENQSGFPISPWTVLYPVYHCGAQGVNRNRTFDQQLEDWRKIGERLNYEGGFTFPDSVQEADGSRKQLAIRTRKSEGASRNDTKLDQEVFYLSQTPVIMSDAEFETLLEGKSENTTIDYYRKAKKLIIRDLLSRGFDRREINQDSEMIGGTLRKQSGKVEGRIFLVEGGNKVTLLWRGAASDFRSAWMRLRDELAGTIPYRRYGRAYYSDPSD